MSCWHVGNEIWLLISIDLLVGENEHVLEKDDLYLRIKTAHSLINDGGVAAIFDTAMSRLDELPGLYRQIEMNALGAIIEESITIVQAARQTNPGFSNRELLKPMTALYHKNSDRVNERLVGWIHRNPNRYGTCYDILSRLKRRFPRISM